MVRLWIALIFALAALVVGIISLRQQSRLMVEYPALHLVALVLIFVVAMLPTTPIGAFYKGGVGTALLLITIREAVVWVDGTPNALRVGVNFFLWFIIWLSMAVLTGGALWSLAGLALFVPFVLLAVPLWRGRSAAGNLWLTLALYTVQMALGIGFVLVLALTQPAIWSALALVGVLLLASTDLVLARDLFQKPVRGLRPWLQGLTFASALLLAISIWGRTLADYATLLGG
jgi:hypothetical protein